ncbi:hypothetical protein HNQ80_005207 [Anaerosolibacter carboniphilus]|uniref:Peptidase C-terminal archaeal/bacterial domain-containing protein n=1 Tax=Anaerosolibacter carboniphilus TaxID=1417629 RepID=A0A841L9J0_9FIRM|nr:PPC domain-containing protein [Anaerosolibacter carboniphilus]MBB6219029.1 hypothetical protein [Anaerosolibacter carboniphilus]
MKRKLLLLSVTLLVIMMFGVSSFAAFTDIEPNDDYSQANEITLPAYISGSLSMYDKYDYYKVVLSSSATLTANLSSSSSADLDLYLFDANKTLIASSRKTGSSSESISKTVSAGTYYVRAVFFTGSPASYTLNVTK